MGYLDMFTLKGKVSVVTGAAQGIGKELCNALSDAGSDIIIADIQLKLAKEVADEIAKKGVRTIAISCDITSESDAQRVIDASVTEFGKIDVLVNNAGICEHIDSQDASYGSWRKIVDVNLNGTFNMSQKAGRQMIKQNYGNIINISSMSGSIVNLPEGQSAYNASKAAVIHLTKSLAMEWVPFNVRVNTIAPGFMRTEMTHAIFEENGEVAQKWMEFTPMRRPGTPKELGCAVIYLASDASSYMTGAILTIDGGYTCW